jgi:hypothetical protein
MGQHLMSGKIASLLAREDPNRAPGLTRRGLPEVQTSIPAGLSVRLGLNYLAHHALAAAEFFRKEFRAFQIATARAIDLNPIANADGVLGKHRVQ